MKGFSAPTPCEQSDQKPAEGRNLTFVAAFGDSYWVADPGLLSPSTLAQRLGIEASSISWSTPR